MSTNSNQLIIFAWTMEIVGVFCGVLNSGYTTFGVNLPSAPVEYVAAIPMVILALAELGRVPLASALFHKHRLIQGVALVGIAALGYLAIENWTFGFERIVDMRLKVVNTTGSAVDRATEELSLLQTAQNQTTKENDKKREELRRGIEQRNFSIAEVAAQLSKEPEIHQQNLRDIRDACRIVRDKCIVPRSEREDGRYKVEVERLNAALATLRNERNSLQAQIDALVTTDARDAGQLAQKKSVAEFAVNEARQAWHAAVNGNQIFRLAASWYGVNTVDVTPEQFASARWVFSTFSAIAVALAGSIAALVYYASNRAPGVASIADIMMMKIARMIRAYYARKRRRVVSVVPGPERVIYREGREPPIVTEKEVPRFIDRIVLIPRWGIRAPTYINSLIPHSDRGVPANSIGTEAAETAPNVTQLNRKVN